jgi:alcohol dehydrogenase
MAFMPWDIYEALDLLRRGLRPFYADMIKEAPKAHENMECGVVFGRVLTP